MNLLNSHDGKPIGVDASIVEGLHSMLDEINPYVQVFQNARDMLRNQNVSNLQVQIICARGDRQYIQSTANEVAAIIVGEDSGHITHRDIVVVTRDGNLKRIKETYPSYMSLQYPLLFPYGIDGWRCGIKFSRSSSKKRQFVSIREFYAFRIQFQYNKGHTLLKGLEDVVVARDTDASAVGRRIILPSSFSSGIQNMVQHFQDAMAICRTIENPDIFITFTCNPNWPEIKQELTRISGQKVEDRPDITARVFRIRHKKLMDVLKINNLFGKVLADISIIEFQKRGLPHTHITLTLASDDKPLTPKQIIDDIICAEIPNKDADPLAYIRLLGVCYMDTVVMLIQMLHRRDDPSKKVTINGFTFDNRWVISYNRDLIVMFDVHINVTKVAQLDITKYLYKYMNKGVDRANIRRDMGNLQIRIGDDELQNLGLVEIELILNKNDFSLRDFPQMPLPSFQNAQFSMNRLIREELDYDFLSEQQLFDDLYAGLNENQLNAYDIIMQSYTQNRGGLFFVYGSGGTSKTYLRRTLIARIRSQRKIVLSVASSGIAAILLPGGRTTHSRFKIPINLDELSSYSINKNSDLAKLIREASLIIWDETPMAHRYGFETVDRTLNDILRFDYNHSENQIFGGKLIILGGDFCQTLPIVPKGRREATVLATIKESPIWNHCTVLHLKTNMRLVDSVYPNLRNSYNDSSYLRERAILAPKTCDVDKLNDKLMSMLPGQFHAYMSANTFCATEGDIVENMNSPESIRTPFPIKRRQFPVKVAFGVTINKSQGQTLSNVGVYLPEPVFSHGQLYIALSRATSPSRLKILIVNRDNDPWNYTKNIVYREVFENLS
ncbi:uncharacterized protein [Coffea arabica]|uniref:ATP-dependent DNA helicase n=1 Tax=Coffea arabica TaxID=13443 RepID=A0ABM4U625_COFAR